MKIIISFLVKKINKVMVRERWRRGRGEMNKRKQKEEEKKKAEFFSLFCATRVG
jgi:hypothetical protein